jgi:hypothetical protein
LSESDVDFPTKTSTNAEPSFPMSMDWISVAFSNCKQNKDAAKNLSFMFTFIIPVTYIILL